MIRSARRLLFALAAMLIAWPALAADPFTVAKVPVDATADTAIEAQTRAIGSGQIVAARQLIERLTLDSERAERGMPPLSAAIVGPLIRGLSIDNERRSATRYLGDVSIAFNPSAVQRLLRDSGLTMVRSQSTERLAVPLGIDPEGDLARDILSGRYAHALTPVLSPSAEDIAVLYNEPSNDQLRALAQRYNVDRLLIIRQDAGGVSATDLNMGTGGQRQYRSRGGMAGIVSQMESNWKATSAVPIEDAQTMTVSVLYNSMDEWRTLQRAINNSAQVRDARLDALSKDGALMTLSYGSLDRLAAEMSQKGVRVYDDPRLGLVIRR
ncbi:hypothetical protein ACFFUB_08265 [Algimonas porphyrae]|uniref:DUF2066 domain-containing protein n=1 Tax=Algimonas porphyrae TaxID=1128113 RepID=A0ABQ5V3E1_9PROT|nr:hypothetical protein [Algimonas porphyrae]GLQ22039.1 hypothetical protein GCM10007854_29940 [Algimonas porphyrae]